MITRNEWKRFQKKMGELKKKRQHNILKLGQPMKREIENPKTRRESKE